LYLAEEKPFPEKIKGTSSFDIYQFIHILIAYNKSITNSEKLNAQHLRTLKGLKTFMSQENGFLPYVMVLGWYSNYLSSISCHDENTKEILLKNRPLQAKETYLRALQEEENEILRASEEAFLNGFNLSPEQSIKFNKELMKELKKNSIVRMKDISYLIMNSSEKEIQDAYAHQEDRASNSILDTVKNIYSVAAISFNSFFGINKDYFSYAPEMVAKSLNNIARPNTLEYYEEHKKVMETYNLLIDECKEELR
jgi:hypothetical protein